MNEQIKREWIKALRSGKYRQGIKEYVSVGGTFCCLGVLLHIEGRITENPSPARLRIAGLMGKDACALADLNDSGATFEQIALCIENGL